MVSAAYFATILGVITAIVYVGMGGGGPSVDIPANGVGFILMMALQAA